MTTKPIKLLVPLLGIAVVTASLALGKMLVQGNWVAVAFFAIMGTFCFIGFVVVGRRIGNDQRSN